MENKPKWLFNNSRILNLTHDDLDGAVSAIVVLTVFPTAQVVQTNYAGTGHYNDGLLAIRENDFDAIIFTDFCPDEQMVQEIHRIGKPYLVIDHHATATARNDFLGTYCIKPGKCGASRAREYFADMADLDQLDTICEVTNDHDLWIRKILPVSDQLNTLFYEYGFFPFIEHFKNGLEGYNLYREDIETINLHDREVKDYMIRCNQHKLPYNGYYIEIDKFNSDINILLQDKYDWLVLCNAAEVSPGMSKLGFRTNRKDVNFGRILKDLGRGGGGHAGAAGQVIPTNEKDEFIQQVADIAFGGKI